MKQKNINLMMVLGAKKGNNPKRFACFILPSHPAWGLEHLDTIFIRSNW